MTRATNFDPRSARHGAAVVVVADGGRARILKRTGRRLAPQLVEIERLERPHAHQLTTDLTGRVNDGGSRVGFGPPTGARHGAQSDYDPHVVEVERFAKQLATRLVQLDRAERMEQLVLIAAPRFLGVLRREIPAPIRDKVSREVSRDLTSALPLPIARAAFES